MYLLDTNILSDLTKAKPDEQVNRRIYGISPERLFASEMTRYELRFGAQLKDDPSRIWKRVEEMILPIPIWLPVDSDVASATGDLDAQLQREGRRLDLADVCIAATALVFELVLVTRNVRHFVRIPGLEIENWYPGGLEHT
jgi:predicted nucleic acid-binding protein